MGIEIKLMGEIDGNCIEFLINPIVAKCKEETAQRQNCHPSDLISLFAPEIVPTNPARCS